MSAAVARKLAMSVCNIVKARINNAGDGSPYSMCGGSDTQCVVACTVEGAAGNAAYYAMVLPPTAVQQPSGCQLAIDSSPEQKWQAAGG